MARLDHIRFEHHRCQVMGTRVSWTALDKEAGAHRTLVIDGLPQLYWGNGTPWHEANLWAAERAALVSLRTLSLSTVQALATCLHAYMKFLELESIDWTHFPVVKADRCLTLYRGELIRARNAGEIAASTATTRMAAVLQFYRWAKNKGLIAQSSPIYEDRQKIIRAQGPHGIERSLNVLSTDLSIPNRRRNGVRLEDGLTPVSLAERDQILSLAKRYASKEFYLILAVAFGTGMRLGSICDLKIQTLRNAQKHPATGHLHFLSIGPGIKNAPVHTKFGVTGQVIIPTVLLETLLDYVYDTATPRRLKREALAAHEHRDLVFLTRFGTPYNRRGEDRSPVLNSDMTRLRKAAKTEGVDLQNFRFHRCRATFATSVADTAIAAGGPGAAGNAVALVRDLLLHKDEATSMRYITFCLNQKVKAQWADAFTREFVGDERSLAGNGEAATT